MVHQCSSLLHSFCFTLFIFISISSWHPLFRLSVSINGRFQCRGGPLLLDQFVQSTDTAANVLLYHPLGDSGGYSALQAIRNEMRVARILKSGALTRRLCSTIGQSDSVLIIREHSQPRGPGLWQHSRTFATTWSRSVTTFENIRVITWSSFGGKSQLRASLSSFASLVYSIESKYFIEWKILNRIKIKPISHRYILSLIARKKIEQLKILYVMLKIIIGWIYEQWT